MINKELIALLQEQDPEAEVMIRTSDGEYEYDPFGALGEGRDKKIGREWYLSYINKLREKYG